MTGWRALWVVIRRGYMGTFEWTTWQAWVSNMLFRPVLFLTVLGVVQGELGVGTTSDLVVALCAYGALSTMLTGVNHSVQRDVVEGTLTMALTTPVRPWLLWASRAVAQVPNTVAAAVAAVNFSAVAFELDLGDVDAAAVVALGAVVVSSAALALLAGVATAHLADWAGVVGLASGIVLVLSGAVIPRSALPGPLQAVSAVVPLAHANDALRSTFGTGSGDPWGDVLAELAVGAGVAIVAWATFAWWVRWSRSTGRLVVEGT